MSTTKPTLAFFGATGGCAGAALAAALRDGYTCTALARTPEKLRNKLTTDFSVPTSILDTHLTIHSGNVKTESDVSKALISPSSSSHLVSTILFGVGGAPQMNYSLRTPFTLDDPSVCATGMSAVLAALSSLQKSGKTAPDGAKPLLIAISTTGVSDRARDVPWLLYPLYHWSLKIPHQDKKNMENQVVAAYPATIRNYTIVRPTLLTDGPARGVDKVRAGWEWGDDTQKSGEKGSPAMGYTVGRTDVGEWIFQKVMKGGGEFEGKCATLTY